MTSSPEFHQYISGVVKSSISELVVGYKKITASVINSNDSRMELKVVIWHGGSLKKMNDSHVFTSQVRDLMERKLLWTADVDYINFLNSTLKVNNISFLVVIEFNDEVEKIRTKFNLENNKGLFI